MQTMNHTNRVFVGWAFTYQVILIIHFALRKRFFADYTMKYGWLVYALCIPAVIVSIIQLRDGGRWSFWLGGFLCAAFSLFGYWVDYIQQIQWRSPIYIPVMIPYVLLYLGMIMFYWWPLALIDRRCWFIYAGLFILSTALNVMSH